MLAKHKGPHLGPTHLESQGQPNMPVSFSSECFFLLMKVCHEFTSLKSEWLSLKNKQGMRVKMWRKMDSCTLMVGISAATGKARWIFLKGVRVWFQCPTSEFILKRIYVSMPWRYWHIYVYHGTVHNSLDRELT